MNAKFFDLKKEKQDRMINAAIKVFAKAGYKHASTDDIVKEAGISKGLLFHYFESKLGVYTFIYEYSVRYTILELESVVDKEENNPFKLISQIEAARMHTMMGYPFMQEFLNGAYHEDVNEALMAIEEKRNTLIDRYDSIMSQINYDVFKSGVDGKKVLKMMEYTSNELMRRHFLDGSLQPEMLYEELVSYIDLMRKISATK